MSRRLPTFSGIERAMACPLSCALPHTHTSGAPAKRGTRIHRFLQRYAELVAAGTVAETARALALEGVDDDEARQFCEAIDLENMFVRMGIHPRDLACEVTFAWDMATGAGRVMGYDLGRDYSTLGEDEICGTADVVAVVNTKTVYIADYKTGRIKVRARDSWQLKCLALAACRAYGCDAAIVELVYLLSDGSLWTDRAEFDAFALLSIERELSDGLNEMLLALATDRPNIGPHCDYCPALADCPGVTSLVRTATQEPVKRIDQATARAAYYQARLLMNAAGQVLQAVKAYASQYIVDLGDGKLLGPVETTKRELSAAVVFEEVKKLYGDEAAHTVCELSTSQTSIQRGLKDHVPKGKGAAALRAVMAAVEKAGGVTVKKTTSITEYEGQLPQLPVAP